MKRIRSYICSVRKSFAMIARTLLFGVLFLTPTEVFAQTETYSDNETIWIVGICSLIAIILIIAIVIKKRR